MKPNSPSELIDNTDGSLSTSTTNTLRQGASLVTSRFPSSLKSAKTELTPVSIRSGVSLGQVAANLEAKKPNLFKFTPNVRSATPSTSGTSTPLSRLKSEPVRSSDFDVGAVLAHSLSLKNQRGNTNLHDLQLRRASAPGSGAFGARNTSDRRVMSVQAKVQQHLHNIRKRKGAKKSMNVLELSWAEGPGGIPLYTPVTLPYVAKEEEEEEEAEDEKEGGFEAKTLRASKRPTSRHIDESNRHAASLFDANNEDELTDSDYQWLFVQFPGVLPALDRNQISGEKNMASGSYCATTLEGLPEGRLGTLKIHKSGKVVFAVGDHLFEVNQGSDCNFSQEVACLIGGNSELMFLGRCNKRIILTPDLSNIGSG